MSVHVDAERVLEALRQGAAGYLEKTTPCLCYKRTARRLDWKPDTVRSYIRQIYRKLEVNSKTAVIAKACAPF